MFPILLFAAFLSSLSAEVTTLEILDKVRRYRGEEETLLAVKTLHYRGTFKTLNDREEGEIDIFFKKPLKQCLVVKQGKYTQVTALNSFEGWKYRVNNEDPDDWEMVILDLKKLKRLRANTWETLNFYAMVDKLKGRMLNMGLTTVDEKSAYRLVFKYAEDIYYERYFDAGTGALVSTINDKGVILREAGELRSGGIRFPKLLVTYHGDVAVNTVTFSEVRVNVTISESLFEMPVDKAPMLNWDHLKSLIEVEEEPGPSFAEEVLEEELGDGYETEAEALAALAEAELAEELEGEAKGQTLPLIHHEVVPPKEEPQEAEEGPAPPQPTGDRDLLAEMVMEKDAGANQPKKRADEMAQLLVEGPVTRSKAFKQKIFSAEKTISYAELKERYNWNGIAVLKPLNEHVKGGYSQWDQGYVWTGHQKFGNLEVDGRVKFVDKALVFTPNSKLYY